jgi:hypothetical protein
MLSADSDRMRDFTGSILQILIVSGCRSMSAAWARVTYEISRELTTQPPAPSPALDPAEFGNGRKQCLGIDRLAEKTAVISESYFGDFANFLRSNINSRRRFAVVFWVVQFEFVDCIEQDAGHDQASIQFIVGGNDVPRCMLGAGRTEALLVGLHIATD